MATLLHDAHKNASLDQEEAEEAMTVDIGPGPLAPSWNPNPNSSPDPNPDSSPDPTLNPSPYPDPNPIQATSSPTSS